MSNKLSVVILLAVVALVVILAIYSAIRQFDEDALFEYDDPNPFRRKCKKCGQWQAEYSLDYHKPGWWEEIYPLGDDPNCECKKYILEY